MIHTSKNAPRGGFFSDLRNSRAGYYIEIGGAGIVSRAYRGPFKNELEAQRAARKMPAHLAARAIWHGGDTTAPPD